MHDICQEYIRKKKGSALDKDLDVRKFTNLRHILEKHTTIITLVFTGGSAEMLSGKQMEKHELIKEYHFWGGGRRKQPMPRQWFILCRSRQARDSYLHSAVTLAPGYDNK